MKGIVFGMVATLVLVETVVAGADKKDATAARQLQQLRAEWNDLEAAFRQALRAEDGAVRREASRKNDLARDAWRAKALGLLRQHPDLPESLDLIATFLDGNDTDTAELVGILRKHHLGNKNLGRLFNDLCTSDDKEGVAFVEELAEKHPDRSLRGKAALSVGACAKWRLVDADRADGRRGRRLQGDERAALQTRAEKYLTLAAEKYADVPVTSGVLTNTVGEWAQAEFAGLKNLPNLRVGKPAPDIVGEDLDGKRFKLSNYRGRVVVVCFWASWCGPCMAMVPQERKLVERLKGKPFTLVGVNGDEDRAKGREATIKHQMSWRSFWTGPQGPICSAWNVRAWPTVYILDPRGVIRFKGVSGEGLDRAIDQLLTEQEKVGRRK